METQEKELLVPLLVIHKRIVNKKVYSKYGLRMDQLYLIIKISSLLINNKSQTPAMRLLNKLIYFEIIYYIFTI